VLDHPAVREYLRLLDLATASLPGPQARELREQIAAHLEDALSPTAANEDVRAELRRLGAPRSLAREAEGPLAHPMLTRLGRRLRRVRWWAWAAIGVAVAVVATWAAFMISMEGAPPLVDGGMSDWLYPQDGTRQVSSQAGLVSQVTVPIRYGQRQGYVVSMRNDSDWTQTVLGLTDPWAPFGGTQSAVAIGSGRWADYGSPAGAVRYALPGSIPPHSTRVLRITWTSDLCDGVGGTTVVTDLQLQVRVGIVTRTEDVTFSTAWGLEGTKESAAHCRL
jgi:hypothetical protein